MSSEKATETKARLHVRNKNREPYDLDALVVANPELKGFISPNKYGNASVDFANPLAVRALNSAILNYYYGIKNWQFPAENLCPPIPGRADYIHHMADLLADYNSGNIPTGNKISCLDVGVGASCIYPIIGVTEYGWRFLGSDTDAVSVASAKQIVSANPQFKDKIECRLQKNAGSVFYNIINEKEKIDVVICNPPFHTSAEDAQRGTRRKVKNLTGKKEKAPALNFAGVQSELICDGGEYKFIRTMIKESKVFSKNCFWFSALVSKQANLNGLYKTLQNIEATQVKTIPLGTGNKTSRIVAWTFLTPEEQQAWREKRWQAQV